MPPRVLHGINFCATLKEYDPMITVRKVCFNYDLRVEVDQISAERQTDERTDVERWFITIADSEHVVHCNSTKNYFTNIQLFFDKRMVINLLIPKVLVITHCNIHCLWRSMCVFLNHTNNVLNCLVCSDKCIQRWQIYMICKILCNLR
jgi:desulfoferrodoxin (superoxide reductase-like protein)